MFTRYHKFVNVGFALILVSSLILSITIPVQAMSLKTRSLVSPGTLDSTFDGDGKVLTDFGNSDDLASSVALQPDGKIVVAGESSNSANGSVALARYNSDGSLDLNFGTNGIVTTTIDNVTRAHAMVLQPDGKIVLGGSSITAGFVLLRYNNNGSLDTSFGNNGEVTTNFSPAVPYYDYVHSLALQPDGKIIAAGAIDNGNISDFALARYNSDGSLDNSFDGDGKVTTDFGGGESGNSVALQQDGKIVMVGSRWNGSSYDFALARYDSNGSLDTTFDGDGKLISDLGNNEYATSVALQTDGKIVAAGNTDFFNHNFALARYNSNGSLDTTFDGDGKLTTDFGNNEDVGAILVQSDGKIVAIGNSGQGDYSTFALARYNGNGSLDITFDGDGKVTTAIGSTQDSASGIAVQSDGKLVVVGLSLNLLNFDFAVARYNTNGSLDTTFHGSGKVTTDLGGWNGNESAYAVAIQSDGKIVVAGNNRNGSYSQNFALARYLSDGSPDLTFGTHGKVTTDFGLRTSIGYTNFGRAIAIQADGKIIVAGSSGNKGGDSVFALERYKSDGSLDTAFGTNGKVAVGFDENIGQAWTVAIQSDGKIIVAGDNNPYPNEKYCCSSFALARYNSDGSLDTTFDGDGKVRTMFDLNSLASIKAITILPNGKILAAGSDYRGSYSNIALARYNSNGSPDTSFDGDGLVTTSLGGSIYADANDLALQPDGKIVIAGHDQVSDEVGAMDFLLARYNANGSLDTTFDTDGVVVTDFGSIYESSWAIAHQQNGKIVVSGYSTDGFVVGRYDNNGSLDSTFGTGGKVFLGFGTDLGGDMALQPDGKIVVVGGSWHDNTYSNYDFAVARILGDSTSAIRRVKGNATGTNNGTSWANAYTDLQSALAAASSGDEIWVAGGTYKPTSGTDRTISFVLRNGVAIYGGFAGTETLRTQRNPTTNITILSGNIGVSNNNNDNSYHVVTSNGINNTTILDSFTITEGNANATYPNDIGGGMYNFTGSPTLMNLIFRQNSAGGGGGMYNISGNPILSSVTFIDNVATNTGGGMGNSNSSPQLVDVTFTENVAPNGGGMRNDQSNPNLERAVFLNNRADTYGGGMGNASSTPTLKDVIFTGNTAGYGGGMSNIDSSPVLINTTFNNNSADGYGGAIDNNYSNPILTNVTITANIAYYGGAGISNGTSSPILKNVTISNNISHADTGGMLNSGYDTRPQVINSILWGNMGGEIGQIGNTNGSYTTVIYSIVQGGYAGTGNLDTDPLLGPLQDNGGFTQTMALLSGSPAINAGGDANCSATDQRGVARPQGSHCDIGAYELVPNVPITLTVTKTADTDDGVCDTDCSLREALSTALEGDTVIFDSSLAGQTITLSSTLEINKGLTIDGSALLSKISVSGNDSVTVFEIASGTTTSLNSLVVTNGRATVHDDAMVGGGIRNFSTLNLENSVISNNFAYDNGGGISNSGTLHIVNSLITNNTSALGGGILNIGESLEIMNSTISENTATEGGGIYNVSTLNLTSSTISNNSARGGGVISTGTMNITNSTFVGNSSSAEGGGVLNYGPATISNSTFSNNSAVTVGGDIYNGNFPLNLINTILANSTSSTDCYNDSAGGGQIGININNLIVTNASSPNNCGTRSLTSDPLLGPLQDNGGSTQTMALLPGSPAINAGNDANCPATDQRGVARPQGSHCDIGGYEYQGNSGPDTTGVFRPSNGLLYLKNSNTTGFADIAINYGLGGDYPVVGDWDGDGTVTIGIYRNGSFYLRNSNTLGFADWVFPFGQVGDQPITGDWNGDGIDTIGVYRPSNGQFLLRNSNDAGPADAGNFFLGNPGDVGIAGDWTGKGFDTIGVFRPVNGIIFLKNTNETGFADIALNYGIPGDRPVTGDWNADGIDTIGVYRNGQFLLRNSNDVGFAEIVFSLGNPGDMPIAGNWDGVP